MNFKNNLVTRMITVFASFFLFTSLFAAPCVSERFDVSLLFTIYKGMDVTIPQSEDNDVVISSFERTLRVDLTPNLDEELNSSECSGGLSGFSEELVTLSDEFDMEFYGNISLNKNDNQYILRTHILFAYTNGYDILTSPAKDVAIFSSLSPIYFSPHMLSTEAAIGKTPYFYDLSVLSVRKVE